MRSRVLSVVAVGCLAAMAGCGGGGSSTSSGASGASGVSGATPLSQDEFVSQADAVCKDVNDQVAALPKPSSTADLASVTQQIIDLTDQNLPKLEAITPPENLQAKFDQYVAAIKAQESTASDLAAAAKAGDTAKLQQLAGKLKASSPDPIAKDLGLTECGKDVGPQG